MSPRHRAPTPSTPVSAGGGTLRTLPSALGGRVPGPREARAGPPRSGRAPGPKGRGDPGADPSTTPRPPRTARGTLTRRPASRAEGGSARGSATATLPGPARARRLLMTSRRRRRRGVGARGVSPPSAPSGRDPCVDPHPRDTGRESHGPGCQRRAAAPSPGGHWAWTWVAAAGRAKGRPGRRARGQLGCGRGWRRLRGGLALGARTLTGGGVLGPEARAVRADGPACRGLGGDRASRRGRARGGAEPGRRSLVPPRGWLGTGSS